MVLEKKEIKQFEKVLSAKYPDYDKIFEFYERASFEQKRELGIV